MSEWRTQAQIDADEALNAAVAGVIEAYKETRADGMEGRAVGEFIVIAALPGFTDELAGSTSYQYLFSNGSMPWHHANGLMHWARRRMDKHMDLDGDEDRS